MSNTKLIQIVHTWPLMAIKQERHSCTSEGALTLGSITTPGKISKQEKGNYLSLDVVWDSCPKYAGLVTLLPPHLLMHTPLKVRYLSVFAVALHERKRRCTEQPVSMAMRRRSSSEIRSAMTEVKGENSLVRVKLLTKWGGGKKYICGAGFGQAHLWHWWSFSAFWTETPWWASPCCPCSPQCAQQPGSPQPAASGGAVRRTALQRSSSHVQHSCGRGEEVKESRYLNEILFRVRQCAYAYVLLEYL